MNAAKIYGIALALAVAGCSSTGKAKPEEPEVAPQKEIMSFNSDSAFRYIAQQVELGPRVPGSKAHRECRDYIISKLGSFNADTVYTQDFTGKFFDGSEQQLSNIIASYNPEAKKRIVLGAHWDTRPWADMDFTPEVRDTPIPGANDGGSGVAVMLEIARLLGERQPAIGVDLVFFDGEDSGQSNGWQNDEDSWCLGSQYWRKHLPYSNDNKPVYGIVFDMVGGKGAKFHRELGSVNKAGELNDKVWKTARESGYGKVFVNTTGGR